MYDTSHYQSLLERLSSEKRRLAECKGGIQEQSLREVWVRQLEKELEKEAEFLLSKGVDVYHNSGDNLSDDELLKELME